MTFFNTVGRALNHILSTPETDDDRNHSIKYVLGPETAPADVRAFRKRFGPPVIEGYGSSENAIIMIPDPALPKGSLGRPLDGIDVVILDPVTAEEKPRARYDEHGKLLNAGEAIGELVSRNATSRFEGYYNNPEADAERTRNGWYWSGDLGYRDEAGVFWFAGRNADWIRVDGENFAAAPIERILARFPGADGVAVYAVPDSRTGDQVMAAIEMLAGATFDPDAFATFLAEQRDLGTKWAPRYVRIVDALPVGATEQDRQAPAARRTVGDDRPAVLARAAHRDATCRSPRPTPTRSAPSSRPTTAPTCSDETYEPRCDPRRDPGGDRRARPRQAHDVGGRERGGRVPAHVVPVVPDQGRSARGDRRLRGRAVRPRRARAGPTRTAARHAGSTRSSRSP